MFNNKSKKAIMKRKLFALMLVGAVLAVIPGCKKDDGGDTPQPTSPTEGQTNDGQGTVNSGGGTGGTDLNTDQSGNNSTRDVALNGDAAVMVDLGLSVRWADRNIGATLRTDYGAYFAWGETNPKNEYTTDTYAHYQGGYLNIGDNIGATQYDPATVNWGDGYMTPTLEQFQELLDNCTWKVTTVDGSVVGYQVTSKIEGHTDRSIFLPCTGDYWTAGLNDANTIGRYWTSDCSTDGHAYDLAFSAVTGKYGTATEFRGHGMCIRPVQYITPTGITLSSSQIEIEKGSSRSLTATVAPENATNKSVTWTSSDNTVATVSDAGSVTAVGKGTATITAATYNGKTAECQVTVSVPVTSISLDKTSLKLSVSDDDQKTYTLTATVKPANADNVTVTWTSSDKSVATVDDNGKVTAVAKGSATITAKAGSKTATCSVTVTKTAEAGKVIPVSCATDGKLPGKFSVSASKQVQFSQGNLQYQASTDTWRFGEAQYSVVGTSGADVAGNVANSDNSNISSTYSGWIDLFGWGTSGYNNKYPYMTSTSYSNYGDGNSDIAGTEYDWGVHNAISNGGNQKGLWRTLTTAEWKYLFNTRTNASSKYGVAEVSGITGMVILPDSWTLPSGLTFKSGVASSYGYQYYSTVNEYTAEEWQKMEAAGAVFLPASGYRYGSDVGNVGSYGGYWSSSYDSSYVAYGLYFHSGYVNPGGHDYRDYGRSVRLATE